MSSRPRAAAVAMTLVLMSACASSAADDLPPAAITSVQNPRFRIAKPGTWSWLGSSFIHPDPRIDIDKANDRIRDAIRDALAAKGFRYSGNDDSTYVVGYAGQLHGSVDDAELDARHALARPAHALARPNPRMYDAGNLVIDIADRRTRTSVWRGASEVVVAFELDDAESRRRTRALIRAMIDRLRVE